jgi:hypothetical protein
MRASEILSGAALQDCWMQDLVIVQLLSDKDPARHVIATSLSGRVELILDDPRSCRSMTMLSGLGTADSEFLVID